MKKKLLSVATHGYTSRKKIRQMNLLYCLVLIIVFSCSTTSEQKTENDPYAMLPPRFVEVLKAHGGVKQWKRFNTLKFDVLSEDDSLHAEHYTLDLATRKDLIVADSFKIGFNGTDVWVAPNKQAFPGKSARFYHNLWSYFFSIPFILTDPGIRYQEDTLSIEGKLYDAIQISYEKNIGDSDQDIYIVLANPNTHQMEKLLYTVTYFSGEPAEHYSLLSYESRQEVEGLLLPTQFIGYKYEDGVIGEMRYVRRFSNIVMKEEHPDETIFAMPEEAEIDSLQKM